MNENKSPDTIESLRKANAQMRVSLDFASVGISHISFSGDILWANPFYLEMIGYSQEDLPLNIKTFTRPEDLESQLEVLHLLKEKQIPSFEFDKVYLKKDGSFNWGHIQARAYHDQKDQPQYVVSVTHDINRRKEFENLLDHLLHAMPSLISYIDKDLVYRYVNQTYERWFGISTKDIMGKKLVDIIGKEAFGEAEAHSRRALKGEYVEYERRLNYLYGPPRDVHVTFIPDFNPIGEVAGIVTIVNDVTHIKSKDNGPLDRHNQMLESLKASSISTITSGIAHQINVPLHNIFMKIEEMKGDKDSRPLNNQLNDLKKDAEMISKVVKNLKSFSRSEVQDSILENNLEMILEDVLAFCGERLKREDIGIKFSGIQGIRVRCKANQLSQVLLNLINHSCESIKYLGDKWIEISAHEEYQKVSIKVIDSGQGLREDVFTEMTASISNHNFSANNLSFHHSQNIIQSLGGKLFYDSSSPHTCFVIELPAKSN